jgi:hypothetical protein
MARVHYWSFLVNVEGQPIEGADVSIYLAGSTIEALVYNDEFSSSSTSITPQLESTTNGYFEFWLPDTNSDDGYDTTQKFKVLWEKTGIASGYIETIDMYPTFSPVNETDSVNSTKDKTVSNALAYLWEEHRLDFNHLAHGISEIDISDSTDIVKDKLLSNYLGYT